MESFRDSSFSQSDVLLEYLPVYSILFQFILILIVLLLKLLISRFKLTYLCIPFFKLLLKILYRDLMAMQSEFQIFFFFLVRLKISISWFRSPIFLLKVRSSLQSWRG